MTSSITYHLPPITSHFPYTHSKHRAAKPFPAASRPSISDNSPVETPAGFIRRGKDCRAARSTEHHERSYSRLGRRGDQSARLLCRRPRPVPIHLSDNVRERAPSTTRGLHSLNQTGARYFFSGKQ